MDRYEKIVLTPEEEQLRKDYVKNELTNDMYDNLSKGRRVQPAMGNKMIADKKKK